jgi:hypothetical protein
MPKIQNWSKVDRLSQKPSTAKRKSDGPGKYVNVDVYSHDKKRQYVVYTAVDSKGNYVYVTASNGLGSSSRQSEIRDMTKDYSSNEEAKKGAVNWMKEHAMPNARELRR